LDTSSLELRKTSFPPCAFSSSRLSSVSGEGQSGILLPLYVAWVCFS
jgi:hypothetical protein